MLGLLFLCGLTAVHGGTKGTVSITKMSANNLEGDAFGNPPDPYVKVWCGGTFGGQTEFIKDTKNPTWSATFYFPHKKLDDLLKLEVWDKDLNYDDLLGTCTTYIRLGANPMMCGVRKGNMYYTVTYTP